MTTKKIPTPEITLNYARNLRANQTDAEKLIWSKLRDKRFFNLKFRRQHPISPYIVDFFCQDRLLIIEIDGGQHNQETDKARTVFLENKGYRVLRYWNNDVLRNIEGVMEDIMTKIEANNMQENPSPHPSPEGRGSSKEVASPEGRGDNKQGSEKLLCIADILNAHGIRGLVKLRCHLEDAADLEDYNPLHDEKGNAYTIKLKNPIKGDWLAEVEGVTDRNASELLRGVKLYIDRNQLPEAEDGEIYLEDLVGCDAINSEGHKIGEIVSVDNFGASDLIEIRPIDGSKTYYLPLTEPYVVDIDIEQKIVVVEPAEEFMA